MDQDARIAVLESRQDRMEADANCQSDRITRLEQVVAGLKTDIMATAEEIARAKAPGAVQQYDRPFGTPFAPERE